MEGNCKLCGTFGALCNSHIVPELCYLDSYDEKHRATKLQAEPNRKGFVQKGIREHLLCKECENKLSKWENAFKKSWYGRPALPKIVKDDVVLIKGLDYRSFKLFHLSILWRTSVANGIEFNAVNLGAEEESIRKLLEVEDPGPEDHYPMFGQILLTDKKEVAYGLVSKYQQSEIGEQSAYYSSYAGVEWTMIVTTDPSPSDIQELLPATVKRKGEMTFIAIPLVDSNTLKIFTEQYYDDTESE